MTLTKEQIEILNGITPEDGFAFFSGFSNEGLNSLIHFACIYASKEGFIVCGVLANLEPIKAECDTLEGAVEYYKSFFTDRDIVEMACQIRQLNRRKKV